jgi:hypothetical protein
MNRTGRNLLAVIISMSTLPAVAQGPFYGRWVVQPYPCPADDAAVPVISITPAAIEWPGSVCRVRASYLVRSDWHIAVRCADSSRDVPIVLRLADQRLLMDWGGASLQLRRCS